MASVGVLEQVRQLAADVRGLVAGLDASTVSGPDAESLVRELSGVANSAQAGVAKLARRLEETARWKQANAPSPEALLGKLTGGSNADGKRLLETSKRLDGLDATREAMEQGRVSVDQAAQIATAAGELADAGRDVEAEATEADLLGVAATGNFGSLRSAAERARQAARDAEAQAAHLRKTRFFRKRRFDDGGVGGTFKLEPGVAAEVYAILDAEADRQFRIARSEGRREGHDAYAADALVEVVTRGSAEQASPGPRADTATPETSPTPPGEPKTGTPKRVEVIARVDLAALYRGVPLAGELCDIVGVGPVPVATIRNLLGEALLTLVLHDGVDVLNVTCAGRRGSKELMRAVAERDGWVCQTCASPYGLEGDHGEPIALGGRTTYRNLKHECRICHKDKSRAEAGITIRAGRERAHHERLAKQRLRDLVAATSGPDPPQTG